MSDRDHFHIDVNALDQELLRQAQIYHSYAADLADAGKERREAEDALAVTEAEAELEIRENPEDFGLNKITEALVKSAVKTHPEVKKARRGVNILKHQEDVHGAACRAMDHKKRMLEKLVELFLADYFAAPRTTSGREAQTSASKTQARSRARKRRREREDDDD